MILPLDTLDPNSSSFESLVASAKTEALYAATLRLQSSLYQLEVDRFLKKTAIGRIQITFSKLAADQVQRLKYLKSQIYSSFTPN